MGGSGENVLQLNVSELPKNKYYKIFKENVLFEAFDL